MTVSQSRDSMKCLEALSVGDKAYTYYSLKTAEKTLGDLAHLPCCIRILLENLIRHEDTTTITIEDMRALSAFHALRKNPPTILFNPSRALISDGTAISVLTDLAAFKDTLIKEKDDPLLYSPACPADIVVNPQETSLSENKERFAFLRWGQQAFSGINLVPPGKGDCGSVNTDFLTKVVQTEHTHGSQASLAYPDTVIGAGQISRAGALGVLAWPSGALDIEALLLGASLPLALPSVLGIKITGKRAKTLSATDIAIAILKTVRKNSGSGKIIEFFGPGLDYLSVSDRIVIADIIHESGAFTVYFPIDQETLTHLTAIGKGPEHVTLVEAYAKAQGLWRESWPQDTQQEYSFTATFEFSLDGLRHNLGGPGLAYNMLPLTEAATAFSTTFPPPTQAEDPLASVRHGDLIWALVGPLGGGAHPLEMVAAGLAARKARAHKLAIKPWVRAVLHIPSAPLKDLLVQTGLLADLEAIGFFIAKEGVAPPPVQESITDTIMKKQLVVCGMSSGTDKTHTPFHPLCSAGYLASPALVVTYALAGNMGVDLLHKNVAQNADGRTVALKELLPTLAEIMAVLETCPLLGLYDKQKAALYEADETWNRIGSEIGPTFSWNPSSTFIKKPSILDDFSQRPPKLVNLAEARILAILGNEVPAVDIAPGNGPIEVGSPAGQLLLLGGVQQDSLGRFDQRSGNENVMARGAFMGPSIVNAVVPDSPVGTALHVPSDTTLSFFEATTRYKKEGIPLVLFAGQNYGHGTGQEWAAKTTRLLGISIVIAESFANEHRVNLIRAGILPLQLKSGVSLAELALTGKETLNFAGISDLMRPPAEIMLTINYLENVERYMLLCKLMTEEEMEIYRHGSLWAETLRNLIMLAV